MGQAPPRFRMHEVVRVVETPDTARRGLAGMIGVIVEEGEENWQGRWHSRTGRLIV